MFRLFGMTAWRMEGDQRDLRLHVQDSLRVGTRGRYHGNLCLPNQGGFNRVS